MNVTMVPMWLLSGVFFSADNFPAAMQPAIAARPLTALNDSLRGVMLDGSSLMAVGPELGILGAWMVVTFAAALRLFRWQ
jgi:ABC-type polysaccharide/polyol phosphate export permease